jgi:hypothetical protein
VSVEGIIFLNGFAEGVIGEAKSEMLMKVSQDVVPRATIGIVTIRRYSNENAMGSFNERVCSRNEEVHVASPRIC